MNFALGKWRTQKLKQEGKQFLKMGHHFAKLQNRLVNYNYATDFRNPAKIRKVVKFRKVAKIYASETRLLDQTASKFLFLFFYSCSKIKTPSDNCPKLVKKTTINKLYMK